MTDQSEIRADLGVVDTDVLIWFKSKDTQSKINIDPEDIKPEMADCIDYLYSYLQINAERECWQSDDDLRLKHFRIVFSAGSKIKAFQIAKKKRFLKQASGCCLVQENLYWVYIWSKTLKKGILVPYFYIRGYPGRSSLLFFSELKMISNGYYS